MMVFKEMAIGFVMFLLMLAAGNVASALVPLL